MIFNQTTLSILPSSMILKFSLVASIQAFTNTEKELLVALNLNVAASPRLKFIHHKENKKLTSAS